MTPGYHEISRIISRLTGQRHQGKISKIFYTHKLQL